MKTIKNSPIKNYIKSGLLIACFSLSYNTHATVIDLTTSNSGSISDGTISLTFKFDQTQPSGTGVLDPFLRIQNNRNEQGYNTNVNNVFDNKDGNFTHDVKLSDLQANAGFYSFVLDIGEPGNNGSLLSLDGLKFFTGAASQSNESTDADGNANGISGTLLWNMDALGDNSVLLDANRNGKPGNGVSDMLLLVPVAVFASLNPSDNIILWSRFGLQENATSGSGSAGTFEEWASLKIPNQGSCTDPVYAASHPLECGGGNPNNVPEPETLGLFGIGLMSLGLSLVRRNRKNLK